MITTKKFSAVKKKTVYWKLNQHYSVQFYLNPVWRKRFLACIENPAEQVGLQLSQYLWISKSDASQCTNPTEGETPDVPQPSKEMQYLQSVNNVYWLDISNNPGLKDISMLTNVKKLFMSRCPDLVNISGASGSRKVDISNCPKIVDFSPLQGIKILRARHNPQIEDVTVFANILSVDLSFCSNIVDISPLSKVPVLTVMGCSKVMNFHTLIENEVLYLSQNRTLRYLPSITSKTVELNFDNCPNIEKIDDLWQGFLRGVDTSVPLQNNEKEIDEDSFSVPFRGIDVLQLDNAHNFKHSRGSELREISMVSCHGIKTISNFKLEHFPLLHTIRICRCMSSKEFCTKPLIREKFCYEPCSNKKRQLRGQQENSFPRFNI